MIALRYANLSFLEDYMTKCRYSIITRHDLSDGILETRESFEEYLSSLYQ
jgi:hypothetical protein